MFPDLHKQLPENDKSSVDANVNKFYSITVLSGSNSVFFFYREIYCTEGIYSLCKDKLQNCSSIPSDI